jgi:pimeloyl-ACP methyl ester carboxylesterase
MVQKIMISAIGKGLNMLAAVSPSYAGKVGFNVFCNPFSAALKPYQLEFLNSAEKFSIQMDGMKVQCYKWGNGSKKILFVHGWASHSFRWKQYIETFKTKDYTLYAFDSRGHGLSEGKYLNLMLNADTIKNVVAYIGEIDTVVCHSFGGFSMAYLLKHFPQTAIKKTVIMGAPGEAKQFFSFYQGLLNLSDRAITAIIKRFKKNLSNTPEYFSSPTFAKEIHIPCLIIHDKNDAEAPVETAIALHENWKGSKIIVTEGLGHHLKSKELIGEIEKFIDGNSSS